MAEITPPGFMQAGTYSARTDRLSAVSAFSGYSGFAADEATPLRIRQGVRPSYQGYQLKARPAPTPAMTVIVSAGMCVIDNHDLAGYGAYVCVNDADVALTIAAADPAKYRRDTVVAALYDAETAGSVSAWALQVVQGPLVASAGAMTRGTLPPNAQVIADINITAGLTSIGAGAISDARNFAVGSGGIVPIQSTIDMDHPHPGQVRYLTDTDTFKYGKQDGSSGTIKPYTDLNWQNITLASGYAARSGATPQVAIGTQGIVYFRGQVQKSSGNLTSDGADHQWGTLPAGFAPAITRVATISGGVGLPARLDIGTDLTLSYVIASFNTSSTNWMGLDSAFYSQ